MSTPRTSEPTLSLLVSKLESETKEAIRVHFEPVPELKYRSGQFLTIFVKIHEKIHRRAYSFCSSFDINPSPSIIIKRIKGGLVSNFLNNTLRVGQVLQSLPPTGRFTINYVPGRKQLYIFMAGGSGITPLFSLAQSILLKEPLSQVHFFYGNRDRDSIILAKSLEKLQKKYPTRLQLTHVLEILDADFPAIQGQMDIDTQRHLLADYASFSRENALYFVCGPVPMHVAAKENLRHYNVPLTRLREEIFMPDTPPPDPFSLLSQAQNVEVHLDGEVHNLRVEAGKTILQASIDAEIDIPFSCKRGACTTCRGLLRRGDIQHKNKPIGLSEEEKKEGYILCCLAQPSTDDVVVEIT